MISPKHLAEMIKASKAAQAGSVASVTSLERSRTVSASQRAA